MLGLRNTVYLKKTRVTNKKVVLKIKKLC